MTTARLPRYRFRPAILRVAAAGFAAALAGCAFHDPVIREATDKEKSLAGKLLDAKRPDSLESWRNRTIGDENAIEYVRLRTAWLVAGDMQVDIRKDPGPDTWTVSMSGRGGEVETGSAAAVTRDGYFLTASHCVARQPLSLVVPDRTTRSLVTRPARVVWNGARVEGHPDIAIIHAPVRAPAVFPLATGGRLHPGAQVFTSGFGGNSQVQSGGQLLPPDPADASGPGWQVIRHDAPLSPGDSGGPLVDRHGRLLGINSKVDVSLGSLFGRDFLWHSSAAAIHVDPAWINSLIARDRQQRR